MVGHTDRQGEREVAFVDRVRSRRADGVILATSVDSGGMHTARGNTPPVVVALDECGVGHLPSVCVDHEAAAFAATSHLLDLGHRRIAHIAGAQGSSMSQHRLRGFRRALAAAGAPFEPQLLFQGDFTVEAGERAMERFLTIPRRPTAVFAANDEMALGALRACRRAGLKVPRDLSVVGFDDQRIAALTEPALTTVGVPTMALGRQAMLQLGRILSGETVEQKLVLPTALALRASTGPPPFHAGRLTRDVAMITFT
jgi:LacI family repressor for deo operon, udp, cdd, tsx, nupC, and nupG